jgi:hypothetical protein
MENQKNRNLTLRETFLYRTISADGYGVIIGGICPEGKKSAAVECYAKISEMKLGGSSDEFLIDYILAEAIASVSPEWIIAAGASMHIPGITQPTGGIIGHPFTAPESADGDIEVLAENLVMLSFPGGPGIIFEGQIADGLWLKQTVEQELDGDTDCVERVLHLINDKTSLYLIVADGSGKETMGAVFVKDYTGLSQEKFS